MTPIASSLTVAHLTIGASPLQNIEAAAEAGFGAVGLRICGRRVGDAFPTPILGVPQAARELRARAADLGVRLSNVSGYQFYPNVTLDQVAPVVEATGALGIPIIVANGFDHDLDRFTDLFARYCELARMSGIRVALEFLPYSGVRTLAAAYRVVERSGMDNAGLLLDALHLERSGGLPADISTVPASRIVFAQLCDGPTWHGAKTDEALLAEARGARLPAGTGVLPLFDYLDALPADCEIEYEVARGDMMDRPAADKACAAAADAGRFMSRYMRERKSRLDVGSARA